MTSHDRASPDSRSACNFLYSLLQREIEGATRKEAAGCCSIGVTTRFGYVYHRRGGLRVYPKCGEADGHQLGNLPGNTQLEVFRRIAMRSEWAREYPYFLELDSDASVLAAIPLMVYAASRLNKKEQAQQSRLQLSNVQETEMFEGTLLSIRLSRIERNPAARTRCLARISHAGLVSRKKLD